MNLRQQILEAFAAAPRPSDDRISAPTYDDEGTAEYFRGRTWHGHTAEQLRIHSSSLSFFTREAYRYFLPAYMLAELDEPETADVIAEHIAFDFERFHERDRPAFSAAELRAVCAFFEECSRRYETGEGYRGFRSAAAKVEMWLTERL